MADARCTAFFSPEAYDRFSITPSLETLVRQKLEELSSNPSQSDEAETDDGDTWHIDVNLFRNVSKPPASVDSRGDHSTEDKGSKELGNLKPLENEGPVLFDSPKHEVTEPTQKVQSMDVGSPPGSRSKQKPSCVWTVDMLKDSSEETVLAGRQRGKAAQAKPAQVKTTQVQGTSRLTKEQQAKYLELYMRYKTAIPVQPSSQEVKDITLFKELQMKVTAEQEEFLSYSQYMAECDRMFYNKIDAPVDKYIQRLQECHKQRVYTYPRFFTHLDVVSLPSPHAPVDPSLQLHHERVLLEMGDIPRANLPGMTPVPPTVTKDHHKISQNFPLPPDGQLPANKFSCSQDPNCHKLAEKWTADIVISSGGLQCLVDNLPPLYDKQWQLPMLVRQYDTPDNSEGAATSNTKKIVFIDKPFVPLNQTVRARNSWYHKFALKTLLVNYKFNQYHQFTSQQPQSQAGTHVFDSTEMEVNLETFGTGPGSPEAVPQRKPVHTIPQSSSQPKITKNKQPSTSSMSHGVTGGASVSDVSKLAATSVAKGQITPEHEQFSDLPAEGSTPPIAAEQCMDTDLALSGGDRVSAEKCFSESGAVISVIKTSGESTNVSNVKSESSGQKEEKEPPVKEEEKILPVNGTSEDRHVCDTSGAESKSCSESVPSVRTRRMTRSMLQSPKSDVSNKRKSETKSEITAQELTKQNSNLQESDKMDSHAQEPSKPDTCPEKSTKADSDPQLPVRPQTASNSVFSTEDARSTAKDPSIGVLKAGDETRFDSSFNDSDWDDALVIDVPNEDADSVPDGPSSPIMSPDAIRSPDWSLDKSSPHVMKIIPLDRDWSQTTDVPAAISSTSPSDDVDFNSATNQNTEAQGDSVVMRESESGPQECPTVSDFGRDDTGAQSMLDNGQTPDLESATSCSMSLRSQSHSHQQEGHLVVENECMSPQNDDSSPIEPHKLRKRKSQENVPQSVSPPKRVTRSQTRGSDDSGSHCLTSPKPASIQEVKGERSSEVSESRSSEVKEARLPEVQNTKMKEIKSPQGVQTNKDTEIGMSSPSMFDIIMQSQQKMLEERPRPAQRSGIPVPHVAEVTKPEIRPNLQKKESCESDSEYTTLPQLNVTYNLWNLGGQRVLVRCGHHGYLRNRKKKQSIHIVPKLEYQGKYGVEQVTASEAARDWIAATIRPGCKVIRARVNMYNQKMMHLEQLNTSDVVPPRCCFRSSYSLKLLHQLFGKLQSLTPGAYLLSHTPEAPHINIKRSVKASRGAYDLHMAYSNPAPVDPVAGPIPWIPVDPSVILPYHLKMGKIPATFDPMRNIPMMKKKKKKKKKKGKKNRGEKLKN